MSGVLGALLASGNVASYTVGVADLGGTGQIFGYNPAAAPPGTISATAFKTTTINNVSTNVPDIREFGIVLNGSLPQSFFDSIQVEGNSGIFYFHTSTAIHTVFGGGTLTSWQWDAASDVWTSAATRFMLIRY